MLRMRAWLCGGLIAALAGACAVGTGTSGDDDALDAATNDVYNGGGDSSTTCNGQPTNLQTDESKLRLVRPRVCHGRYVHEWQV